MSSENEMLKTQATQVYGTINGEAGCVGQGERKKSNFTGVSRYICVVLTKMG